MATLPTLRTNVRAVEQGGNSAGVTKGATIVCYAGESERLDTEVTVGPAAAKRAPHRLCIISGGCWGDPEIHHVQIKANQGFVDTRCRGGCMKDEQR